MHINLRQKRKAKRLLTLRPEIEIIGGVMCEMIISKKVCRRTPVRIARDRALDGLAEYVRKQCATPQRCARYLASVGLTRSAKGRILVTPM